MKSINIEKFNGFDITIDYDSINKEYGDKCKDLIKQNASRLKLKKSGRYINGWTTTEEMFGKSGKGVIVHNATDYQLTHLLENGHAIVNKKDGTGWSSARPHINPAYRSVKNKYIKAMEEAKINIK